MHSLWQDLRYAMRQLAKSPGFAVVAIITLALGIGANTAIFSVVNAVLLKPLPYFQPDRLVAVDSMKTRGVHVPDNLSYPDFFDFRARNHVFEHLITGRHTDLTLTGSGAPVLLDGGMTTWDLFPTLGIQLELGRGFLPSEEAAGTHVVVLSHALWQMQFGGERSILGRTITLNREPYTVVGVAPAGFAFPVGTSAQLWTTIAGDQPANERGARYLTAMGRLKPGVTLAQARADLNVIAAELANQYPDDNANVREASVRPALETIAGQSRAPLLILLAAVGLVLLIACANIANLLLARTAAREREMAVRSAVGAGRWIIIRQLLAESLLLATIGGMAGIVLAEFSLRILLPLGGKSIPRLSQTTVDGHVLGFSLLLVVITCVVFGMAPAVRASRVDLTNALKEQARGGSDRRDPMRQTLVIGQVALGLILVSGAGLLMDSFLRMEGSDLGLNPDHLLTFWFSLPEAQYNKTQQVAFYDQLLERLRALPGVKSAAGVWPLPLGGDLANVSFNIEERPAAPQERPHARMAFATPDYFSTADIPLLKGRFFSQQDDAKAPPVLIVTKAFADKYFPGEDALGKRITPGTGNPPAPHEIVGVVGDSKLFARDAAAQPMYYFPYKQLPWQPPVAVVRAAVPPRTLESAIRRQVAALDPAVPVFQVSTMDELLSTQVTEARFATLLLGCFAGFALLLTMIGLYGVMAYSVTRRTLEIGVRVALGASRWAVLSMVLRQAVVMLAAGLVLGVVGSFAEDRLLGSALYGVSSLHPIVLAVAALLVGSTGLLASYVPARRAAKVEPMMALRYE